MKRCLFLASLLLLLLVPRGALGEEAAVFGDVRLGCGACHTDRVITAPAQGGIDFRPLRRERAGDEKVCRSCHNGVVKDSRALVWERFQHPTGVRAKARLKLKGLPLDDGQLFCGTCHTPHVRGEGIGLFMRFRGDDPLLCQRCHPGWGGGIERGQHPLAPLEGRLPPRLQAAGGITGSGKKIACATCHRTHGAASPFLLVINPWGEDGLCQACHGADPSRKGAAAGVASHPVNRETAVSGTTSWSRDALVVSPGGKVDCWSCHRGHGTEEDEHLLVSEIAGGTGCLRCHPGKGADGPRQGNHPVTEPGKSDAREAVTCRSCHRAHNATVDARALLSQARGAGGACSGCHADRFTGGMNHPVGTVTAGKGVSTNVLERGGVPGDGGGVGCSTCHRVHGSLPGTSSLVAEEKKLCFFCHEGQAPLGAGAAPGSHPVLVVPARPEELAEEVLVRLGDRGEVICTTCHRVHKTGEGGAAAVGGEFPCAACHLDKAATDGHVARAAEAIGVREGEETCLVCHRAHGWGVAVAEGEEDVATRVCRSCHREEGTAPVARDVSHPVGVKLQGSRGLGIGLPLFLDNGRRFKKGSVSCATCHDVHGFPGDQGSYLRESSADGARLCLECHPEKETLTETRHDLTIVAPDEVNLKGVRASEGGVCSPCHTAHGGFERTGWARLVDGQGQTGSQLCRSCHRQGLLGEDKAPGKHSHPAGITAGWSPGDVPGATGEKPLTCLSCHDPHRWDPADPNDRGTAVSEGGERNSFLKWPNDAGSSLCLRCHGEKSAVAGTEHDVRGPAGSRNACDSLPGGGSLCGGCHLVHRGRGPMGWPETVENVESPAGGICGECHREGGCAPDRSSGIASHPVGRAVPGYRGTELPLYDGTGRRSARGSVTCSTCHDVHRAGQGGSLRLKDDGHAPLCVECHESQALVAGTDHDLRVSAPGSTSLSGGIAGQSGICAGCHAVHGGTYDFFLWDRPLGEGTDLTTRLCTGCHRKDGIGKVPASYYRHFEYGRRGSLGDVRRVFTLKQGRRSRRDDLLVLYTGEGLESEHGYIACPTCHDPHRWDSAAASPGPGEPVEGGPGESFLRLKGSFAILNSFCADCHENGSVELFNGFHQGAGGE